MVARGGKEKAACEVRKDESTLLQPGRRSFSRKGEKMTCLCDAAYFLGTTESFIPLLSLNLSAVLAGI